MKSLRRNLRHSDEAGCGAVRNSCTFREFLHVGDDILSESRAGINQLECVSPRRMAREGLSLLDRQRLARRVELAARHVVQAAQSGISVLEMPAPVAEHAAVGPRADHLADEEIVLL